MNINSEEKKYISLTEASMLSGVSRDYLNVLIHRGKLQAVKSGKNWLTTEAWLAAYHIPQEEKISVSADKYLSLFNASQVAGVTPGYLNVAVRRGKLRAVKLGRNWFTTKDWVEDYQRSVGRLESKPGAVSDIERIAAKEGKKLEELKQQLGAVITDARRDLNISDKQEADISRFRDLDISNKFRDLDISRFKNSNISRFQDFDISKFEVGVKARNLTAYERARVLEKVAQKKIQYFPPKPDQPWAENISKYQDFNDFVKAAKREAHKFSFSRAKLIFSSALIIFFAFVSVGLASGFITPESFVKPIDRVVGMDALDKTFRNFDSLAYRYLNIFSLREISRRETTSKSLSAAVTFTDVVLAPFRAAATFSGDMPKFFAWFFFKQKTAYEILA